MNYALGTNEGQITMLREFGLVPSLLSALDDPFVAEPLPFWGDQPVWQVVLDRLEKIKPIRGTPFFADADEIVQVAQTAYLNGSFDSAQAALDDAANQIALVTGLPVAE